MALINCPECNHNSSSFADSCPNCGFPINKYYNSDYTCNTTSQKSIISIYDDYIQTINGLKIDISNLIATNNYDIEKSYKILNSISHIGIVKSKSIIDTFIEEYPEFNKKYQYKIFIDEQSQLNSIFKVDKKIDKISVDHSSKLFRLGFWSYIYKFDNIKDVCINEINNEISIFITINHQYLPDIKITLPTLKNRKYLGKFNSLLDFSFKNYLLTKDEALKKAEYIKSEIENLTKL